MSVLFKSLSDCGYREPRECARCGASDFREDVDPEGRASRVCAACGLVTPPVQDGDA